jgi:DNA-binding NarL/FixJ family response regulator
MSSITRMVLADDHPIFLAGVRKLLETETGLEIVGEARTGLQAFTVVKQTRPDLLLLDIAMPELGGIALSRRLETDCPSVRRLFLTLHEERSYIRQALETGASGYVLKTSAAENLLPAIRAVMVGGMYVDPSIASAVVESQHAASGSRAAAAPGLSPREAEVLQLTAKGFSNKEIARRLDVSVKTVEAHKAHALGKLAINSRSELISYAVSQGWFDNMQ